MSDLRESINHWQENLTWNSNYLGNHDQPRIVSRFGNDKNIERSQQKC